MKKDYIQPQMDIMLLPVTNVMTASIVNEETDFPLAAPVRGVGTAVKINKRYI